MNQTTFYFFAHNLKGFRTSTLRVKVNRVDGSNVFVTTADLLDAGTNLVLDVSQLELIEQETVEIHKTGLVAFA